MSPVDARSIDRRVWLVAFLLLTSLLSGCALTSAQRAAVNAFGGAAKEVGTTTSTQVLAMRASVIQMNTERLVMSGHSDIPDDTRTLDRTLNLTTVQTVIGATDALAAYGQALVALATNDESAKLKTSTDQLTGSLTSLPGGLLSAEQAGAIAIAIQEVGGIFVEYKRKQAIETIVLKAGPAVNDLCDQLAKDFAPGAWVETQLATTDKLLLARASSTFMDAKSLSDRRTALEGVKLADTSQKTRTDILPLVVKAATAAKAANTKLIAALATGQWSLEDVDAFVSSALRLRNAVIVLAGRA